MALEIDLGEHLQFVMDATSSIAEDLGLVATTRAE